MHEHDCGFFSQPTSLESKSRASSTFIHLRRSGLSVLGQFLSRPWQGNSPYLTCLSLFPLQPTGMLWVIWNFALEQWPTLRWGYWEERARLCLTPRTSGVELKPCLQITMELCFAYVLQRSVFEGISQWIRAHGENEDLGFPSYPSQIMLSAKCWTEVRRSIL